MADDGEWRCGLTVDICKEMIMKTGQQITKKNKKAKKIQKLEIKDGDDDGYREDVNGRGGGGG